MCLLDWRTKKATNSRNLRRRQKHVPDFFLCFQYFHLEEDHAYLREFSPRRIALAINETVGGSFLQNLGYWNTYKQY